MKGLAEYESRLTSAATKNLRPDSSSICAADRAGLWGLGLMGITAGSAGQQRCNK